MQMSLTVLIIEDTPANMRLFTVILSAAGYQVLAATTAQEGIALARSAQPNLILMDIQLPSMNGIEATILLKADPLTAGISIIAVTAFAMKGDEEKIRAAGCDEYLSKPVHHKVLLQAVNRVLGTFKQTT
jgi:two-component system cell cycle response regulator DivK